MPPYLSEESPPSVTLFLVVLIAVWGGDYAALLLVIWGVDEAALSSVPLLMSLSCRSVKGTRCKGTSVFWKGSARASVALGEDCSSCRSLWYQVPILPHWASSLLRVLSWHCSFLCVSWGESLAVWLQAVGLLQTVLGTRRLSPFWERTLS